MLLRDKESSTLNWLKDPKISKLGLDVNAKNRSTVGKFIYRLVLHKYDYTERFEKLHKDNILTYNEEDKMD